MNFGREILIGCLGAILVVNSSFASYSNCSNSIYRKHNPSKCAGDDKSFFSTGTVIGGVAVLGAGLALVAAASAGSDSGSDTGTPARQPTMQVYDTVGYTDPTALAAVMSDADYNRNFEHFNEIRVAYSLARGFTGKESTIAVLDTGDYGWHGAAVESLTGGVIAPDAIVNSYKIVDDNGKFLSYNQIGNIIAGERDAKIFNASWGIETLGNVNASNIRTRAQMVALTDANFVNQITEAAARDAIFVWAAGNDGTKQSNALSALPRVISELNGRFINVVAWDTSTGQIADYSNHCGVTQLYCITAPGSNIDIGNGSASGTSFATPIVSSAVAVIQEAFPYMNATEITQLLFATARDLGDAGVDEVYGWGMLDLERATRPVGAPLVPLADNMQPLQTARASGVIARRLKSANLQFAFFDAFGRAFSAQLNDNITFTQPGRAFDRLRGDDATVALNLGKFEFGFARENLLMADGFLQTNKNDLTSFVGLTNDFTAGDIQFFQKVRVGFSSPAAADDSFISGFSNIYSASVKVGAAWRDWAVTIATPESILAGTMNLRLPAGRAATGHLQFADYQINLSERPALEYSVRYKFLTASYIDNPQSKDEFFMMAKTRFSF